MIKLDSLLVLKIVQSISPKILCVNCRQFVCVSCYFIICNYVINFELNLNFRMYNFNPLTSWQDICTEFNQ